MKRTRLRKSGSKARKTRIRKILVYHISTSPMGDVVELQDRKGKVIKELDSGSLMDDYMIDMNCPEGWHYEIEGYDGIIYNEDGDIVESVSLSNLARDWLERQVKPKYVLVKERS